MLTDNSTEKQARTSVDFRSETSRTQDTIDYVR